MLDTHLKHIISSTHNQHVTITMTGPSSSSTSARMRRTRSLPASALGQGGAHRQQLPVAIVDQMGEANGGLWLVLVLIH